jgi:hypothetical protein
MTYPTEEQPQALYSGQDTNQHPQGGGGWQGNDTPPRPASDAYPMADGAAHREGPEGEGFMMSGLMRRYNR